MGKIQDFKQTKIGRIPKEWEIVTLGDIALDLIGGGTPSTSNPSYWDGDVAWMTSAHINKKDVTTGQRYITREGLKNSATNLVPKDNLLIATRVGIGKVAVNKIDMAISQDLTGVIVNKKRALTDFLYWGITVKERKLKSLAQGSTIKGVLREDLGKLTISLPPLSEQEKIAEVLSTADEALQKVDEAIGKTERLKKGLMHELLTKGIGHNVGAGPSARPDLKQSNKIGQPQGVAPTEEKQKIIHNNFKETEIGRIPKEWEVKQIRNLGKVFTGKTPPTARKEYWDGKFPFITPFDIGDEKYVYETERYVSAKGAQKAGNILPKDAVLVVCIGSTIGKIALTSQESISNQQINALICNDEVNPHYVYYAISSKSNFLKSFSGTAAVPIIKKSLFETFKLPRPPFPEQQRISEILSTVDKRLELLRAKKTRFERIKKGLMEDLLTGRKRVRLES